MQSSPLKGIRCYKNAKRVILLHSEYNACGSHLTLISWGNQISIERSGTDVCTQRMGRDVRSQQKSPRRPHSAMDQTAMLQEMEWRRSSGASARNTSWQGIGRRCSPKRERSTQSAMDRNEARRLGRGQIKKEEGKPEGETYQGNSRRGQSRHNSPKDRASEAIRPHGLSQGSDPQVESPPSACRGNLRRPIIVPGLPSRRLQPSPPRSPPKKGRGRRHPERDFFPSTESSTNSRNLFPKKRQNREKTPDAGVSV